MEERAQNIAVATSIIEEAGYFAKPDEDGDLIFKIEGVSGFFELFDDDDHYARISMRFDLKADVDIDKAIRIANRATLDTKAVKSTIDPVKRRFYVSVESFFDDIEHLRRPMNRILSQLVRADADFFTQLPQAEPIMERKETA